MKNYLDKVTAEEKTKPIKQLEKEYDELKQKYTQYINEVDDVFADLIFKMNSHSNKYPAKIRQYVENDLHAYIEKKKQAFEILKINETPYLKIAKDPFFSWIFDNYYQTLSSHIERYTTLPTEEEESAYNNLCKRRNEYEQMLLSFDEGIEKVRLTCLSNQALKTDFFMGKTAEEIRGQFMCYVSTCHEVGNMVLSQFGETRMLMSNIENAIGAAGKVIEMNQLTTNKLKIYKVIIHQVDKYFELMAYYKKALEEMNHNIAGLMQSKTQLLKYYNAV